MRPPAEFDPILLLLIINDGNWLACKSIPKSVFAEIVFNAEMLEGSVELDESSQMPLPLGAAISESVIPIRLPRMSTGASNVSYKMPATLLPMMVLSTMSKNVSAIPPLWA